MWLLTMRNLVLPTLGSGAPTASTERSQALPTAYYEQLKDTLFGYKEVSPRDYFDHLDYHWCKMDTKTIKSMTKFFYEPWNQVDHVTKFAQRLDNQ